MFKNRKVAAEILAKEITENVKKDVDLVSASTITSIETAEIVAEKLELPVSHLLSTKLFVPGKRDVVFGAVSQDGTIWLHDGMINSFLIDRSFIGHYAKRRREGLNSKNQVRGIEKSEELESKNILLITDGISSGMRVAASLGALTKKNVGTKYVAAPFVSQHGEENIAHLADEVISLKKPKFVASVNDGYATPEKSVF
jgi:putative phosphoribosyl transferase